MMASVVDQAADQLGQFLPRLAGALLLLIIGLIVAALVGRLIRGALIRLGVDRIAERWGTGATLERAGLGSSLSRVAGSSVRLGISVVVVFAALSLLGLEFLSQSLNEGVLFIPRLITAAVLLLFGVILAALLRERIDRWAAQMDLPISAGPAVQGLVIVLFALTAATELGVSTAPLLTFVGLALAAFALTLTIAFGLGAREVARSLSSARYARGDFVVGQTIRIDDLRGRIVRIGNAATTLEGDHGRIRVPNHLLIERVVIVETEDAAGGDTL